MIRTKLEGENNQYEHVDNMKAPPVTHTTPPTHMHTHTETWTDRHAHTDTQTQTRTCTHRDFREISSEKIEEPEAQSPASRLPVCSYHLAINTHL